MGTRREEIVLSPAIDCKRIALAGSQMEKLCLSVVLVRILISDRIEWEWVREWEREQGRVDCD